MAAYYNEIDAYAAGWLRNLIASGLIPAGDVDERSIVEVRSDELRGYTQCHFFAGIGGWALALRLAGWADDRSVWTGSCPCQPFSAAGKKARQSDERHLWPHWNRLIGECAPAVVFGEQVDDAVTSGWLDDVFNDLEAKNYACAASVLPACSVGKPHRRDRIFFVADAHFHGDRQPQCGLSGAPQAMAALAGQENGAARQSGGTGRSGGTLAHAEGERIRRASGDVRQAHGRPDGKLSLEPDGAGARDVADAARGEMGSAGQPREYIEAKKAQGHGMANLNDVAAALWPTPTAGMQQGGNAARPANVQRILESQKKRPSGQTMQITLEDLTVAQALWKTPKASDGEKGGPNQRGSKGDLALPAQAHQASLWTTPSARDWKDTQGMSKSAGDRLRMDQLPRQIPHPSPGSHAPTEKSGQLNPEFVCWLMGFPPAWDACAPTAMPSSRKSRRNSSSLTGRL